MKVVLAILLVIGCVLGTASAEPSDKLFISTKLEQDGKFAITGFVRDGKQEPVPDVIINITTPSGTFETKSDSNGVFRYVLSDAPALGKLDVNIRAQKEGYLTGYTNTSFFVKDNPPTNGTQKLGTTFKVLTADKMRQDPLALKILQNIELNKQQEAERLEKLQEISERQKFIDEQRQIANQNLLNDLGFWFEQFDPFNPRNAFSSFALQMDATVQDIYWAQFNFTETKTKEGLAALEAVLASGGSAHDARKAFYEKAATPRNELLKVNDDFNEKYAKSQNTKSD